MKPRIPPLLLALGIVLSGCGINPPGGGTYARDIISADDIAGTVAHSAYEVVERLQPQWLTARGYVSVGANEEAEIRDDSVAIPNVILNGMQVGNAEYLRNVLAEDVAELRYYGPGEAGARFGMGHPRGVIVLTLK